MALSSLPFPTQRCKTVATFRHNCRFLQLWRNVLTVGMSHVTASREYPNSILDTPTCSKSVSGSDFRKVVAVRGLDEANNTCVDLVAIAHEAPAKMHMLGLV
jgi:hypothetical protein